MTIPDTPAAFGFFTLLDTTARELGLEHIKDAPAVAAASAEE